MDSDDVINTARPDVKNTVMSSKISFQHNSRITNRAVSTLIKVGTIAKNFVRAAHVAVHIKLCGAHICAHYHISARFMQYARMVCMLRCLFSSVGVQGQP